MSKLDKSSKMNLKHFKEEDDEFENERLQEDWPSNIKGSGDNIKKKSPKKREPSRGTSSQEGSIVKTPRVVSNKYDDFKEGSSDQHQKRSRNQLKKDKHAADQQKDLYIMKYRGLDMFPKINEIYGEQYMGADEASLYSSYLRCCGQIPQILCCLCSACKCGPIVQVRQGYIGLVMELGKFIRKVGPGLHTYNSCTEQIILVDMRIQNLQIPSQDLITKDNISIKIDCFVLYKILIPEMATFKLGDYKRFISYTTMGTMKTIISEKTLSELLEKEDDIEMLIKEIIDDQADDYGIKIHTIETRKIEISPSMVNAMATIALSEKETEGKIVAAKGNYESARIFREAADELSKNPLSLQLHYFETMKEIASENSQITIMPGELIDLFM